MDDGKGRHRDFLVVGSINFDILLKQERFPKIGETLQALGATTCPGGKGANQAAQIGKLGGDVGFFGAVGDDAFGEILVESLRESRVDAGSVLTKSGSSGLGVVNHVEGGRLMSTIVKGANYGLTEEDVRGAADSIRGASYLILQNEIPQEINETAIDIALEGKTKIAMNAAPVRPISGDVFDKIDYLILNEVEASYYLGREIPDAESAILYGRPFSRKHGLELIITLGPRGSVVVSGDESWIVDPIDVPVVETTGAGDSYIGALVFRLSQGRSLLDACRFANCAGSITIQAEGALSSMPDLNGLLALYDSVYKPS